jgi:hypothetical protein
MHNDDLSEIHEQFVWQSNVPGISDRFDPYLALGVPRDLGRSASDHVGDLEPKELPRRILSGSQCDLRSVRLSAVIGL